MKSLAIIKAGSTFLSATQRFGDFEDWIIEGCDLPNGLCTVFDVADKAQRLPDAKTLAGVIITGSHAMVTDQEPWIQQLAEWIPLVLDHSIPLLGICFGHQIMAHAMGGWVSYHPNGREVGSVAITLTPEGEQDPLLGTLPGTFMAHTTHAQTVIRLPEGARLLASNTFEAHHAFRVGKNAWGVQFHPEFSADVMSEYINEQKNSLLDDGYDIEVLHASVCNTEKAHSLLKRFIMIVREGRF